MDKFSIIKNIGEECIDEETLRFILENKKNIICYDGFEPSGRMHIAQGILRSINTNKLTSCGCTFKFWIADWFALMNNKLGGDIEKIENAGKLMIETWKACGMDMDNVEFVWSSKEINNNPIKYWSLVIDIATKFNLKRILKCTPIMGRSECDDLMSSQILYPIMQCADIFYLNVDICSLGTDQRKVNMLAREYCDKINLNTKPIIISHHMLIGLNGENKMSKSAGDSSIFMDDSEEDIKRKISKAFCPTDQIIKNPILEYTKYIIFCKFDEIEITCQKKSMNDRETIIYSNYDDLAYDYQRGKIHPKELKLMANHYINKILSPIREHFNNCKELRDLQKTVKSYNH